MTSKGFAKDKQAKKPVRDGAGGRCAGMNSLKTALAARVPALFRMFVRNWNDCRFVNGTPRGRPTALVGSGYDWRGYYSSGFTKLVWRVTDPQY